ncbi:hypothetical protein KEJ37_01360 [Candidatus Bathyarchaeota archaeon]|nr:hypothetical protein [Candidatus Bathyarchaeota archaeon]
MDLHERRVIGALLLLLGVSLFAIGLYTGHLEVVIKLLKEAFGPLGF